jgi:hypothetical protein
VTKHLLPQAFKFFGLSLSLTASSWTWAQSTETTDEIESFFDKRAQTLQDHLSVPLSDQAFHKRFIEAYEPLDKGRIPAQWRDALVQRMLALAGVNAANLTPEQQAQIANSLNVLGSAGATSSESAAALAALGGALGISSTDAGNALSNAASDKALLGGNASVSQSFINNSQSGQNMLANQSSSPNSLTMAQLNPPSQVKYDSEGPITGATSGKLPNPASLTLGAYASKLGQPAGALTSGAKSGGAIQNSKITSTPPAAPHADIMQQALKQGVGAVTGAVKGQTSTSGAPTNSDRPFASPLSSDHQGRPFMQNPTPQGPPPPSGSTPTSTATQADPFKFDPQVLLGGDYLDQYQKRVQQILGGTSTGSSDGWGLNSPPTAGSTLSSGTWQKQIQTMGDTCEKDLHKMYGFTEGQVPANLSYEQVTEMWRTFAKKKHGLRSDLAEREEAERKAQGGFYIQRAIFKSEENFSYEKWNPLDTTSTPKDNVDLELVKKQIDSSADKQVAFNTIVDDLFGHFAAQINGLANTDQDACIFAGTQMGNPKPDVCGQEFAISSNKDGTFRNSALTNQLKMVALLDAIRELNSTEATAINAGLKKNYPEQFKSRFGFTERRSEAGAATQTRTNEGDSAMEVFLTRNDVSSEQPKQRGFRRSYRLQDYLFKCPNAETSWMAKIQDLEVLARRSLVTNCGELVEREVSTNPEYADVSTPLYPATQDICSFEKSAIKNIYKEPKEANYPDFFGQRKKLSGDQCDSLLRTHQSLAKISQMGQRKCQYLQKKEKAQGPTHTEGKK